MLSCCCDGAGGIHHVCLEVADVKQSLSAITPAGVRVLDPEPKIGAHGNPVRAVFSAVVCIVQQQQAHERFVLLLT